MNLKNIAYLAVPYSHEDPAVMEERYLKVNIAAAKLIARGEVIFSPISHNHPVKVSAVRLPDTWEFWEAYDLAFLGRCAKMYVLMLPGWEISVGVTAEIHFAVKNDIEVQYLEAEFATLQK